MKIKTLEYGDDPEDKYQEDFNSFKVYEVWSDPDVELVDGKGLEMEEISDKEAERHSKRLAVAVELPINEGSYFFIERSNPNTEWLSNVWSLLKEEGWQRHHFKEIRNNCRGEINVIKRRDYTAVIDQKKGKVLHNRGKKKGSGSIDDLEEFWTRPNKRLKAYILKVKEEGIKVRLENGEKIWIEDRIGISKDFVGENVELTVVVLPGTRTTDTSEEIQDKIGIYSLSNGKFPCKIVAEVTGYDVEDTWPEAKSKYGYPLVELDTSIGRVVIAHENVPPVEEKQPYHEEGTKWKMVARKLMLEDIDII